MKRNTAVNGLRSDSLRDAVISSTIIPVFTDAGKVILKDGREVSEEDASAIYDGAPYVRHGLKADTVTFYGYGEMMTIRICDLRRVLETADEILKTELYEYID